MSIPTSRTETETLDRMSRLGITRVPADQFHYKGFRYTRLADAVAQAERDAALSPPTFDK
ncbi:hypothetical protein [Sphingomonas sanxanigenens]|uniref:Uncharacterized protein n=1 Tax=Sphingomonas sanxanigenens DSM 19645 = NX02 TaxID=1123269 RepID=W0AI42_9SPHN|nr:hypothetical protein [Sphingomonas sanxanigenens]AHE55963.1 hypothetical protein NX02_21660 [Sphingomonas sanxanigenens DSM 19645 = NX02]